MKSSFGSCLLAAGLTLGVVHAGHSYQRRSPARIAHAEAWMREARRLGVSAVLFPAGLKSGPDTHPTDWVAKTGKVLAVRNQRPPVAFPPPPSLSRLLYFQPFLRRGPDQIPLPGQAFFERWVSHGGAALSTFSSRERFSYVADSEVPAGDVLFALAYVAGGPRRSLRADGGVLHLARLRAGRRQDLGAEFLQGLPTARWTLPPDRRPLTEVLSRDAAASGLSLIVDEPLAVRRVWAGGAASPGAFIQAAAQALPASSARLGTVVGMAAGRLADPPTSLGKPSRPWNRTGWVSPRELLPTGWFAHQERRLWIRLLGAKRPQVRAMAAWVSRARRPKNSP